MILDSVNDVLTEEQPARMIVQSYDVREARLTLAFVCDGGPKEDEAYVVEFGVVALFHLPAVLHSPAVLAPTTQSQREALVPGFSYDAAELSGAANAYTVVQFADLSGNPFGYYVAAKSVAARWVPRSSCLWAW